MEKNLAAILIMAVGIFNLYPPTMAWLIRFRNMVNGSQTQITRGTIWFHRISGTAMIVIGLTLLLVNK